MEGAIKMKRFIIIVSVYDEANTQAYPLGGIFDSHKAAKDYMLEHLDEVLGNHWTKDREDGIDEYFEEVNLTGFEAKDNDTGQSLEIDIHELPEMFEMYIVPKDFGNFYVEKTQFWAGTHTAAVYTKEEADAIVEAERTRYNLKGTHGPYAVKLVPDQVQLIEEDFPMDDPRLTEKQKKELGYE